MKFAHDFQNSLEKGEYPQEWVDSAIPYRKLKKCIKRVQEELRNLGLDHKTLDALWQQVGSASDPAATVDTFLVKSLRYSLASDEQASFTPKLTIAIDPRDGTPMDAWLSPETRHYLRGLAREQRASRRDSIVSLGESSITSDDGKDDHSNASIDSYQSTSPETAEAQILDDFDQFETIEIPLTSDSEFFQILRRELSNLEQIQANEQKKLTSQIVKLSQELSLMKTSSSRKSKAEVDAWREILRLYSESQVFFSSVEKEAGVRDAAHAQTMLQAFSKSIASKQGKTLKLDSNGKAALDHFMHINFELLRFMKFQEINRTALTKIMKKFDKQTALHARGSVSHLLSDSPFITQDLAKAACFTISEELLPVIPQLDDYLCPICFSISFKPIRLRCNHVFCIRCLIVMQRAEQDHCPLCRGEVVLEASSCNLDKKLMAFLKANFPQEVKAKQRANEMAAGVDRFGEAFETQPKCAVM